MTASPEDIQKKLHHPHDKFFRTVMANQRVARDFLKAHLPSDIREVIDFNQLEIQPRFYINDLKKETIVDVLFKTSIEKQTAYIYLLIEQQTNRDALLPFRLLRYMVNIMNDHIKKTQKKKLPLIYPIVLYNGKCKYRYSTDLRDLVNAPKRLIDHYFLQPFHLIDLSQIQDEEIKNHAWALSAPLII